MTAISNTSIKTKHWLETLEQLSWDSRDALHSAKIALAKASWLGLDKTQAIEEIVRFSGSAFLMENSHLLYEVWVTVSEETACPNEFALVAA
jgi:hypothetical protein